MTSPNADAMGASSAIHWERQAVWAVPLVHPLMRSARSDGRETIFSISVQNPSWSSLLSDCRVEGRRIVTLSVQLLVAMEAARLLLGFHQKEGSTIGIAKASMGSSLELDRLISPEEAGAHLSIAISAAGDIVVGTSSSSEQAAYTQGLVGSIVTSPSSRIKVSNNKPQHGDATTASLLALSPCPPPFNRKECCTVEAPRQGIPIDMTTTVRTLCLLAMDTVPVLGTSGREMLTAAELISGGSTMDSTLAAEASKKIWATHIQGSLSFGAHRLGIVSWTLQDRHKVLPSKDLYVAEWDPVPLPENISRYG